jgi:cytochrome c-type biogenesis protein CcmF
LMGIAPLTMWYRSSLKRIEMSVRWPALISTLFIAVLFAFGIRSWGALLGFWIVGFSGILTLLEFWKGTRARMRRGEGAWGALTNLMSRNRRRYGGYWIHIGVLVMAFGIIGTELFQQETQIRLQSGESVSLGHYEMVFNQVERYNGPDDLVITEATVDLYQDGTLVRTLHPRSELYTRTMQPMTIPNARSTITEDFYVLLVDWEPLTPNEATFRIYLNPLINWIWAGAIIFAIGTLVAAWPDKREERIAAALPAGSALGAAD